MIPNTISVGILAAEKIHFSFHGSYVFQGKYYEGRFSIETLNHHLVFDGKEYVELLFEPTSMDGKFFELEDVVIGINFHWQKNENQQFKGALKFIFEEGKVRAINIIDVEDYLTSVISSEMKATSSMELLKAHAVISRSWLLKPFSTKGCAIPTQPFNCRGVKLYSKWYERDAHSNFDICADDHCQRYQGITKISSKNAAIAVEITRGEILMSGEEICDARFYKSCGGATEAFECCWADEHYDYLDSVRDSNSNKLPYDLTTEKGARKWIEGCPDAFCNTQDKAILKQVLNDFDQNTMDFYRWEVRYTRQELSELVKRKSGIDFGMIRNLIPMKRGKSGRIMFLKVVGDKDTVVVGKELEIRKWLSESHLYSSAFVVDMDDDVFILKGAGWGHGVGLCQIGAAMMSEKGYDYKDILTHYYQGAKVKRIY